MADVQSLESFKERLGYTEKQWETWKSNPRNLKVAENAAEIRKHKIIAEVTNSYGCAAGHKVGDKIVLDGAGCLLCKESPERICFGLLSQISQFAAITLDKLCLGEDPTRVAFNKFHCVDVGVDNGGWGEVVAEVKVEKIQE